MTGGKSYFANPGDQLKVKVVSVSENVTDLSLNVTDLVLTGGSGGGGDKTYDQGQLKDEVSWQAETKHRYLLDLLIISSSNPAKVHPIVEVKGTKVWDEECTKNSSGPTCSWKITVR